MIWIIVAIVLVCFFLVLIGGVGFLAKEARKRRENIEKLLEALLVEEQIIQETSRELLEIVENAVLDQRRRDNR